MTWKQVTVCGLAVLFAGVARPARAQGVLQAMVGATKAADQHPFVAGMIGAKGGIFEIDGEFGRLQNVVPKDIAATTITLSNNRTHAELPAWYGMGSLRFVIPPHGPIEPFVMAGAGAARLEPRFTVQDNSVTLQHVFGESDTPTKFLVGFGGGLRVKAGHFIVDGGYRWMRIFQNFEADTNTNNDPILVKFHMFYVGAGVKF